MTRTKARTITMPDELWDAMLKMAARNGRNASAEVRLACSHWLATAGGVRLPEKATAETPSSRRRYARSND